MDMGQMRLKYCHMPSSLVLMQLVKAGLVDYTEMVPDDKLWLAA